MSGIALAAYLHHAGKPAILSW